MTTQVHISKTNELDVMTRLVSFASCLTHAHTVTQNKAPGPNMDMFVALKTFCLKQLNHEETNWTVHEYVSVCAVNVSMYCFLVEDVCLFTGCMFVCK